MVARQIAEWEIWLVVDAQRRQRRKRVRWAAAIAVSLGVHVLLLLVPVGEPDRKPVEPIELELLYAEKQADLSTAPPATETTPRAGPDASAETSAREKIGAAVQATPRSGHEAPADSPRTGPEIAAQGTPRRSAPAEAEPVPVEPPATGVPEPRRDEGVRREAPLALEPRLHLLAPPPEEIPAPREKTTEETLQGLFADDRAVRRATEAPDSYWSGLRHKLEDGWTVSRDQLRDGPRTGLGIRVDKALDDYLAEASAYGATGTPYGDGPWVPGGWALADKGRPVDAKRPPPTLDTSGENSTYSTTREALVLVVQGDDGRILDVRLHRSSGHQGYDRAALARAKALAAASLDEPPKDGRTSLWSFEAKLVVTPPLPIAGCAVDAYFIPQHCFYPLSERTKQAVRLLAVWGPGEAPGLR